jgi:ADP-ribosylglycohydrolase
MPWTAATVPHSDGCGTVMRTSPTAFLPDGRWQPVTAWQAAITHGKASGIAASLVTAAVIREAAQGNVRRGHATEAALDLAIGPALRVNVAEWLVGHPSAETAEDVEQLPTRASTPSANAWRKRKGPLTVSNLILGPTTLADGPAKAGAQETVATALLCVDAVSDEPIEALRRATVTGGDSDSIAAVAGAILGALHRDPWPTEWADRLEPRYKHWIIEAEQYDFDGSRP